MRSLSQVNGQYGAPMGRGNSVTDPQFPVIFEIQRLRWVDGAYDEGGAYWGHNTGTHIYWAEGDSQDVVESIFVRAKSLIDAKKQIGLTYPNASFAPAAELDSFLGAYIEAALWSTTNDRHEDDPDNEAEMLDTAGYEIAPETRQAMAGECEDFLSTFGDLIGKAGEMGRDIEHCGHDFWLTRNGHGSGFWDRDLGDVGDQLTRAADGFGNVDLYVGDDDLIHAGNEGRSRALDTPGL